MTKFVKDLKHKKRGIVLKDIQPMEKKKKEKSIFLLQKSC